MVDLPTQQYPVTTTKPVQPGVSGADFAQPYAELAATLKQGGEATETVAKSLAAQAGAQAVSRDANGDIQVQQMPFIGPAAQVYEHSTKMAALTEADGEAQRKVIDMRVQYKDDPQGFLSAVSAFAREQQKKLSAVAGPEVGNALFKTIDSYATSTYSGLQTEKQNLDLKANDQTFQVGMKRAYDTLQGLARNGRDDPNDPDVKAALSQFDTLAKQRMAIPALNYTPAKAAYDREQLLNEMTGSKVVYLADKDYKDAPVKEEAHQYALDRLKAAIFDPKLQMSQEERQKYLGRGETEIRANEAVRRNDINELHASWREMLISPGPLDPAVIDKYIERFKALGSPMNVAMVQATAASKHLLQPFLTEPLANQVEQQKIMTGLSRYGTIINNAADVYGMPAELLARQLHFESGFDPKALGPITRDARGLQKQAKGISQFEDETAKQYNVDVWDPQSAIPGMAHMMSDMTKKFGGNYGLGLAAYNWGEGNLQKWIDAGSDPNKMPAATRNYIQNITGHPITDFIGGKDVTKDITGGGLASISIGGGNLEAADKALHFTPEERALYQRHLDRLNSPGGADKSAGTNLTTVQIDDKTYNIPTVWDGKDLPVDEAIERAKAEGLDKFPSYPSRQAADERYAQINAFMEKDTAELLGQRQQRRVQDPAFRSGLRGNAVPAYVLASQQREIVDNSTTRYAEIVKAWNHGEGPTPSDADLYTILDAARQTDNGALAFKVQRDIAAIHEVNGLRELSLPEQHARREVLTQVIAGGGPQGEYAEFVRKLADTMTSKLATGLKDSPIATTSGIFNKRFPTPAPLNFQDQQQLAAGLNYRGEIARFAAQNYKVPMPPALDPPDLNAMKAQFENPDPAVKARILEAINTLPEDVRNATLKKLGETGPEQLVAAAAGGIMREDPAVASSLLQGQALIKQEHKHYLPSEGGGQRQYNDALDKALPTTMFPPEDRADASGSNALLRGAIKARYAFLSAQDGDSSGEFKQERLNQSVRDVTGGTVVVGGLFGRGSPVVVPYRGMPQSRWDALYWGLTDDDLKGVTTPAGEPVTAQYLHNNAKLENLGDGQYGILLGNDPQKPIYAVTNANTEKPKKFILNMRNRTAVGAVPVDAGSAAFPATGFQ